MTIELKREILNFIESPELHAYLIAHTERLRLRDYVSIIAGAPISLKRKQLLLYHMKSSGDLKTQELDYLRLCCECVGQAVQYLTIESGTIFLIQLMGYDDNNRSDIMDGPYIATSLAGTKRAVREYYCDEPVLFCMS